jgi:hypothetical protein
MTPRWLTGCVVGVVATTAALAVAWMGICSFYIGPRLFNLYEKSAGKLPAIEPDACKDADARAVQVLTGLLATLMGLMSNPPGGPK